MRTTSTKFCVVSMEVDVAHYCSTQLSHEFCCTAQYSADQTLDSRIIMQQLEQLSAWCLRRVREVFELVCVWFEG